MSEVKIQGLVKQFDADGAAVEVLTGVDLELAGGDAMAGRAVHGQGSGAAGGHRGSQRRR